MKDRRSDGATANLGQVERVISVMAGSLLVLAILRRSWLRFLLLGAAGLLYLRGIRGGSRTSDALDIRARRQPGSLEAEPAAPAAHDVHVTESVVVDRTPDEVYLYWRNLQNLPRFMSGLIAVTRKGQGRSHWVALEPVSGRQVEWDAEITEDRPGLVIAWRSLPGADTPNSGRLRLTPAGDRGGTELRLELDYALSGGLTTAAAGQFREQMAGQLRQDLQRFKDIMESGNSAAARPAAPAGERQAVDVVEEASKASFPASDPPGWTGTGV